jgi:outer membrane protein insertion porin family
MSKGEIGSEGWASHAPSTGISHFLEPSFLMQDEGILEDSSASRTHRPQRRVLPVPIHAVARPAALFVLLLAGGMRLIAQQPLNPTPQVPHPTPPTRQHRKTPPVPPGSVLPSYSNQRAAPVVSAVPTAETLRGWAGLMVKEIRFAGVNRAALDPLPQELPQQPDAPLDPIKMRDSLRRLYATGLYRSIVVDGERQGGSVVLIFQGEPTLFIGRVSVSGVKNTQLATQLSYSTRLVPGTPYTQQ